MVKKEKELSSREINKISRYLKAMNLDIAYVCLLRERLDVAFGNLKSLLGDCNDLREKYDQLVTNHSKLAKKANKLEKENKTLNEKLEEYIRISYQNTNKQVNIDKEVSKEVQNYATILIDEMLTGVEHKESED